jgi:glycosyltransferase involved in cell wall biosynthesis
MPSTSTRAEPKRLSLCALTQGIHVPSTRFRLLQHLGSLASQGLDIEHLPARHGAYPPASSMARLRWLPAAAADALQRALRANRHDACFLQRELVSTLQTAEALIRRPIIFDVDDAIFLHRRGRRTDNIARRAELIICGNRYLAQHYAELGPVTVLPTAVDTERFVPSAQSAQRPVIGWSGSSSGFPYLYAIEDALRIVLERHPSAVLKVVAERAPAFRTLPADRVRFEPWHPDTEVRSLQGFSVGLMPLFDDSWARGKCSFKMLTYMAVGIPVVVSPVGMNAEVLALGDCGHAATARDDWIDAIDHLLCHPATGADMGRAGRRVTEQHFSCHVVAPRLGAMLRAVAQGRLIEGLS